MNMINRLHTLSIAVLALAASGLAFGQSSESGTFDVTATVESVCSITAGNNLAFGNYDPVAATTVAGTTTVDVTCSNGMTGTEVGLVYTGSMSDGGTGTLAYILFQENTHTDVWGDEAGVSRQAVTADGTAKTLTVYGQIDADQTTAPTGSYTETVTASVYW